MYPILKLTLYMQCIYYIWQKHMFEEVLSWKAMIMKLKIVHCPPQKHNCVHFKFTLRHLHRPRQSFLQLHFTSSRHPLKASVSVVHDGVQFPLLSFCQPHSEGQPPSRAECLSMHHFKQAMFGNKPWLWIHLFQVLQNGLVEVQWWKLDTILNHTCQSF